VFFIVAHPGLGNEAFCPERPRSGNERPAFRPLPLFPVFWDVEVAQDPALVRIGHDPQLEKAVEVVMEELKKNPPPKLRRPAFPNHYPTAGK
jgi:hypothetical protein